MCERVVSEEMKSECFEFDTKNTLEISLNSVILK